MADEAFYLGRVCETYYTISGSQPVVQFENMRLPFEIKNFLVFLPDDVPLGQEDEISFDNIMDMIRETDYEHDTYQLLDGKVMRCKNGTMQTTIPEKVQ